MVPRSQWLALGAHCPSTLARLVSRTRITAIVVLGVLSASVAYTCCMAPLAYPGNVDQARQDAVIFHDGTTEDLILGVSPVFPEGERGPEKLLWVVTIPSPPVDATASIEYAVVDRQIFQDAEGLASRLAHEFTRATAKSTDLAAGVVEKSISVAPPVEVGPYTITAVRGVADPRESATALNNFLDQHGYPAEPVEEILWFTERNFTFLCIEIKPPNGSTHFETTAETPALRVTFPSDRVYYPAKYSARQGNFALGLTIFSAGPLEQPDLEATQTKLNSQIHLGNLDTAEDLPGKLGELVAQVPRLDAVGIWYVTPIGSFGFNPSIDGDVGAISQWDDDVFMAMGPVIGGGKVVGLFLTIVLGSALGGYVGMRMRRRARG